jgi:hypothetical protein
MSSKTLARALSGLAVALAALAFAPQPSQASTPGWVWPFPTKSTTQFCTDGICTDPTHDDPQHRVDEGWDMVNLPGGGVVRAIAAGTIVRSQSDRGGFGNDFPVESLDSPVSGAPSHTIYYGHVTIASDVLNKHVNAGDVIGTTQTMNQGDGSNGPAGALEIGFMDDNDGYPVGHWQGSFPTPAGLTMKQLLFGAPVSAAPIGRASPGVARSVGGQWQFLETNNTGTGGTAQLSAWTNFGNSSTDIPLVGDWDHDGRDTPGVARKVDGQWQFLETNNTGTGGTAQLSAWTNFGNSAYDTPLAGDWDGS